VDFFSFQFFKNVIKTQLFIFPSASSKVWSQNLKISEDVRNKFGQPADLLLGRLLVQFSSYLTIQVPYGYFFTSMLQDVDGEERGILFGFGWVLPFYLFLSTSSKLH